MAKTANRWFKSQILSVPHRKQSLGLKAAAAQLFAPKQRAERMNFQVPHPVMSGFISSLGGAVTTAFNARSSSFSRVLIMRAIWRRLLPILLLGSSGLMHAAAPTKPDYFVYIGSFTNKGSKGIYAYRYRLSSQELTPIGLVAQIENPTFLAISPDEHYLYSISAVPQGSVSAFRIDGKTGGLTLINRASSHGGSPCHLLVDHTGKTLFVANFASGSTAALRIRGDGGLDEPVAFFQASGTSKDPVKQLGPHEHSVNIPRSNRFMLVADLGIDKIFSFQIDPARATFTANDPPFTTVKPGSGPRHLAFSPDERYVYVLNEIASNVTVFRYTAATGALEELQTISTLPEGFTGDNTAAEIEVAPSGKFVYCSNRGHDSIAQFVIDRRKGTLSAAGHTSSGGQHPRYFAIDPSHEHMLVANQDSNTIALFDIDKRTGHLKATGKSVETPSPNCIRFVAIDR
jgi:6-phosphogluconolactonase